MLESAIFRFLLLAFFLSHSAVQQETTPGGNTGSAGNTGNGTATAGNGTATTGNGTATGNRTNSPPLGLPIPGRFANGTCDPFHAVCPEYTNGSMTCDPVQVAGQIIVNSPNDTSFFYANENINVTISYTANVDPQYPASFVSIWYRRQGSNDDFIGLGNMTRGNNSRMVQISSVSAGAYEILMLADGIDATQRNKAGIKTSCLPDGWPYSSPKAFKLLERNSVNTFSNPFGPSNGGSAYAVFSAGLWISLSISFILLQ